MLATPRRSYILTGLDVAVNTCLVTNFLRRFSEATETRAAHYSGASESVNGFLRFSYFTPRAPMDLTIGEQFLRGDRCHG